MRLSICFRKTEVQRSLQRNFIVSRGSARDRRGRDAVRLFVEVQSVSVYGRGWSGYGRGAAEVEDGDEPLYDAKADAVA